MSVIGARTDETNLAGVMEEDEGYENITVFSELKQSVELHRRELQNVN
jgi:ATP-dependent DNA helicase 2 subunit 2